MNVHTYLYEELQLHIISQGFIKANVRTGKTVIKEIQTFESSLKFLFYHLQ